MAHQPKRIEQVRRSSFFILVLGTVFILTWMFSDLLWRVDFSFLKTILVFFFSVLTYPVSIGFWQSVVGFLSGIGPQVRTQSIDPDWTPGERTVAINIPVYNEDIETVLARLRAIYLSLKDSGHLEAFDFYLLSDSNKPDNWISEEYGWARLCRQLDAFDHVFYRRRRRNVHQKAGNLLNFCESWGRRYKYMVILDADSLMEARTLVNLCRQMEDNPGLGILQTVPVLTRARSRYALLQQFANRIYGPLFSRGLAFWQGSKGNYWGHNAIIRVDSFIRHCALPDLPGHPPLGGKILSHDFVEAALMVKAGYQVRMDTQSDGSFEEGPTDLLDSAMRDRRWCQGNLQHIWLLFADKIHGASKCHFINGIFSYVGSFFWLLFLMLSIALAFEWEKSELSTVAVHGTSPLGALSIGEHGLLLFAIIIGLLLAPKILGLIIASTSSRVRKASGGLAILYSMALMEILVSTLVAPILMVYHSRFVLLTLFGKGIGWPAQPRSHHGLTWKSALTSLRLHTVIGVLFLLVSLQINLSILLWISPIWIGLLFSSVLAVSSSRPASSALAKRYIRKSESSEIEGSFNRILEEQDLGLGFFSRSGSGFQNAVVDPIFNAIHLSILDESIEPAKALPLPDPEFFVRDPARLTTEDEIRLLESSTSMKELHRLVWRLPDDELHPAWRAVVERYTLQPIFNP